MGSDPAPGTSLCPLSSSIYKLPFKNRFPHRFEVGDTGLLGSLVDSPEKPGINRAGFVNAPLARLDAKHPRRRERMEGSTRAIGFHSRRATRRRHPWASRWMSEREIRRRRVRLRLPPPPLFPIRNSSQTGNPRRVRGSGGFGVAGAWSRPGNRDKIVASTQESPVALFGSQTVRSPGRSPAAGYPRFSSCPACSCQANGREDRRLSR